MTARLLIDELEFRDVPTIPARHLLADGELISISLRTRTDYATHSLHRFPAKFVPQIPAWAIREFSSPGERVLDPFVGSGTTLVEALIAGRKGIGFDIDALARLITQGKSCYVAPERLKDIADELRLDSYRPQPLRPPPMEGVLRFDHWFSPDAWAKLQWLREHIQALDLSEEERRLLWVVFSSTLRVVSRADDQTQKTYVSGTRPKIPPETLLTFERHVGRAIKAMGMLAAMMPAGGSPRPWVPEDGDALAMPVKPGSIDLIVTSPPYVDSVDYPYNFLLEYFWLGPELGVRSRTDFNWLRRGPVGAKRPSNCDLTLPNELEDQLDLEQVAPGRRPAVASYLRSMRTHLFEASMALRAGGHYVLVVGNSTTNGEVLPVHNLLVVLGAAAGLRVELAFAYRVRRHYMKFPRSNRGGIILLDWVLVFTKQRGRLGGADPLPVHRLELAPTAVAN